MLRLGSPQDLIMKLVWKTGNSHQPHINEILGGFHCRERTLLCIDTTYGTPSMIKNTGAIMRQTDQAHGDVFQKKGIINISSYLHRPHRRTRPTFDQRTEGVRNQSLRHLLSLAHSQVIFLSLPLYHPISVLFRRFRPNLH